MELKQYWNVIWKRRWLVLAIVLLVTAVSGVLALTAKKYYQSETRFITRQQPTDQNLGQPVDLQGPFTFTYDRYYNWFGSEFLVDDYTQIVDSDAFSQSIIDTLKAQSTAGTLDSSLKAPVDKLKVKDLRDNIGADRKHRELHLTIVGPTKEMAKAISDAAAVVLTEGKLKPVKGQMVDDKARFSQIDESTMDNITSSTGKEITNAITKIIMGLVAALALAFLLEYLDGSVRDERDAQRVLDMPVLGTIPRT